MVTVDLQGVTVEPALKRIGFKRTKLDKEASTAELCNAELAKGDNPLPQLAQRIIFTFSTQREPNVPNHCSHLIINSSEVSNIHSMPVLPPCRQRSNDIDESVGR